MNWTSLLPLSVGWYWFKEPKEEPKCIQIVRSTSGTKLLFNDSRLPRDLYMWQGLWAGPIPEPAEEKFTAGRTLAGVAPTTEQSTPLCPDCGRTMVYACSYCETH